MSLKPVLESLDGLHEEVAKLYVKKDGKFVLDVEESGLKSALEKERERADAAEKALKAREKTEADEKAKKEREDLEKRGEYEKLSAADKAAIKAAEEKAQGLEAKLRKGSRERALLDAITDPSVKGIAKALLPHLSDLIEDVPDGEGWKHVVKGNPAQKLTEFIGGLKKEMPWGFEATGASGFGTTQGNGGAGNGKSWNDMNLDERSQLYKTNPEQAKALQQPGV